MTICVTGSAGFIGLNLTKRLLGEGHTVIGYDKLSYAGKKVILKRSGVLDDEHYTFVMGDVTDHQTLLSTIKEHGVELIFHLAAETSVDRSIDNPGPFVSTNLVGTYGVLEAARKSGVRVHYCSTDEVFGELGEEGRFNEQSPLDPRSPYAATKAGGNFLAKAYATTYGLGVTITSCSNNYGPYQHPEKLIPIIIDKVLSGSQIQVHGDGQHVRDWLYVDDHCRAMIDVAEKGKPGSFYCVGGDCELTVLQLVDVVAKMASEFSGKPVPSITHVEDRAVNDRRYAIDHSLITSELGWVPSESWTATMLATVMWYIEHEDWWR